MREAAETIKKKIAVQAFLKFTSEDNWESLEKEIPTPWYRRKDGAI